MKSFFEHHGFYDFECDDEDQDRRLLRCNRCGSTDVRWRQQGGEWVLFSLQPGVVHECAAAAPASDFEAV